MTPLSIFLLDDNEIFLHGFEAKLTEWLEAHAPSGYSILCFTDIPSMLEAAKTTPADLVISDIDLGTGARSGIDGVSDLKKQCPGCAVIYLTAYLSYVTDVFETSPIYYILKDEYETRIDKAMRRFFQYRTEQMQYVSIVSGGARVVVPLKELVYCERKVRNIHLLLEDGRDFTTNLSVKELYDLLPKEQFSICHRGYIVNHRYISATRRMEITLSTGNTLPVGRSYCDSFRDNYHRWLSTYVSG